MDIFFKCKCGRQQSFAPSGKPADITTKEAESIGWTLKKGEWVCPICNFAKVKFEIFAQDCRGKRESLGEYESAIENYVVCISMRKDLELSEPLRFIHIEFKGRI